jgi:Fe-S-cluster containining protein
MAQAATTRSECEKCPALCCKDLSIRILRPRTKAEIEDLKWQLQFDTVRIYIRNGRWYQLVKGRCMYLGDDNRCTIYAERPEMCRKHNPPDCEFFGRFYDVMIETPGDLEAYLARPRKKTQR